MKMITDESMKYAMTISISVDDQRSMAKDPRTGELSLRQLLESKHPDVVANAKRNLKKRGFKV